MTKPTSISRCVVSLSSYLFDYDGKAKYPAVTVKSGSTTLKEGTDYTVSYSNNVYAGSGIVTVAGIGNYTGSKMVVFVINKVGDESIDPGISSEETPDRVENTISVKSVSRTYSTKKQTFNLGATALDDADLSYVSSNSKVKVTSSGKVTIPAKFIGKATITIVAGETGSYLKTVKKITVKVTPTKTTLSSVSNAKGKKLTVKWKKNTAVTGYQIQYSTSKTFAKGNKTVAVTKKTVTSKTVSGLKKGKTYYVRIRTYKTVSGEKIYSGWSSVKKVKITK